MRQRIRDLAMAGVAALILAGCGGGEGSGATFTVSGLASGLSLVLKNTGGDNLPVSANGTIAFHNPLAGGAHYAVTIATQPTGENCVVVDGSGNIACQCQRCGQLHASFLQDRRHGIRTVERE